MIVVMAKRTPETTIASLVRYLEERGYGGHVVHGVERTVIGVIGAPVPGEMSTELESLPGVDSVVRISKPFKLASRELQPHDTVVQVGEVRIGGDEVVVMAGPCAVESEEQVLTVARAVRAAGASVLRGGAFKPRTSPYSFRGLGEEGLKILATARAETGLPIITEVMTVRDVELVAQYADILQIGARNMQNFLLLEEAGRAGKPVMLKRGLSATIEEWLLSAEYILAQRNPNVILCERGIRTFETATRNTLDISAIPVAQKMTHLPVVSDPSHGTGKRELISPLALASVAAGADGLIIEVHPDPDRALSDGPQSLNLPAFQAMMPRIARIAEVVGRTLPAAARELVVA